MSSQKATPHQLVLDIGVQIQADVNGIEMGVLENGIPYLTQNGLAKIAGVAAAKFMPSHKSGLSTLMTRYSPRAATCGSANT